ncbi:unnamed protein product [Ambrosiozyma monospora]|uniref:Unnamed protein product n=1 Tax=Ambrosiozyma monospora TaxID=43982 RepID=A0ACB5U4L6_AMBMO|nr:unnamed protein product [Ambrosiozyma monospora]
MRVFFGIWAGGDSSNAEGTIQWAGGSTDYSDAPFTMYIKSLVVADYSTGESYSYKDQSGDYTSIEAENGEVNGRVDDANEEFDKYVNGETVSSGSSSSKVHEKNVSDINSSSAVSGSVSQTATGSASASGSASITDSNTKSTDGSSSLASTLSTIVTSSDYKNASGSSGSSDSDSKSDDKSSTAKSVTESNLGQSNVPTAFAGFLSMLLVAASLL